MAMKMDAGKVNRGDLFLISPEHIIVDDNANGRWKPHDEAKIAELVASYEVDGQLQPVQVRKLADHKVTLVLGFRRVAAVKKFNELHPDKPMQVKCVVATAINEEDAFRRNIEENRNRAETTPVDDAVNQRRLRDVYQWTDKRIAELYGCNPSVVSQLKKLLTLSNEYLEKVHSKELSLQAALSLVDLTDEEKKEVLAEGTSTKTVRKKVRKKKQKKNQRMSRNLTEVKEYFEGLGGPAERPELKALAECVLKFINGSVSDEDMGKQLVLIFDVFKTQTVVPDPVPEPVQEVVEPVVETPAAVEPVQEQSVSEAA